MTTRPAPPKPFRYRHRITGTAARLGLFLDDANLATRVSLGLYSDGGGRPATLLAACTLARRAAGRGQWHECGLSGQVTIVAGTTYWLAVLSPAGGNAVSFRDTASGGVSVASQQTDLVSLPGQWSSGQSFGNGPVAGYVLAK